MSTTASAAGAPTTTAYQGTERLLWGIVLAVITFFLFANSLGATARSVLLSINGPQDTATRQWTNPYITLDQMNLAVSLMALCSGLFVVAMGRLADRVGRVKILLVGNAVSIVGSVMVAVAFGQAALPLMLGGRALQGLSGALIMPAALALIRAYWDGKARQRAVSMFAIGSFGGSGAAAFMGGALASSPAGWRATFILSVVVSVVSILLVRGTPESRAPAGPRAGFDVVGLIVFMVSVLGLMGVVIFGSQLGWTSPTILILAAVAVGGGILFVWYERRPENPFIDFGLFRNSAFTGATVSNFVLNGCIGMVIVTQQMLQVARPELFDPWRAGLLTIGYAVVIIAFIRVGEKLLQRFGPRKPMLWGSAIVALSAALLLPTHLLVGQYTVLAVIAYASFGFGLAFYATPATDAALSNLPTAQAGAGAGIFKMASSLGAAIGVALSLTIFTTFAGSGLTIVGELLHVQGIQDNAAVRQAGMLAVGFNLVLALIALISIAVFVPKGGGDKSRKPEVGAATGSGEREAVLARLSSLPTEDLRKLLVQPSATSQE